MTTRATELGAAGLLVPREVDEAGWMAKMLVGRPETPLPVLSVRTDLHAAMKAGGEVVASVPLPTVAVTGTNVHGVFAAPADGAASVLLVAHYDGVGDDPEQRLPAAVDNASGCAVILEPPANSLHRYRPARGWRSRSSTQRRPARSARPTTHPRFRSAPS